MPRGVYNHSHLLVPLETRFMRHVSPEPNSGCWLWVGSTTTNGYGHFRFDFDDYRPAHRVAYELYRGPIPAGLVLDHLCRTITCVNPYHLEPVTNRVNTLRGIGFAPENLAKTHCPAGHPYNGENLHVNSKGRRLCLACRKIRDAGRPRKRKCLLKNN